MRFTTDARAAMNGESVFASADGILPLFFAILDRENYRGTMSIGAYRLSPKETIDNIQTARRLGANGVILFSYDSMVNPRQAAPDYLAVVGRAAFTTTLPGSSGSR